MIRADAYVRESAIAFLLTRREWAEAFLREIEETRIVHKEDVPDHLVKRFLLFEDPRLRVRVEKIWPAVRPLSSSQKSEGIKKYTTLLRSGTRGNVTRGRDLYLKNCGMCHRLFDEGGTIGPELTGYDRKDVGNMVLHLVDPGADIREGYELQRVSTVDGRVLEGRITHQTGDSFIITPPLGGKPTTLLRNQIADMRIQNISSMPERLLESMTEEEVADFFSYLSAEKKPE